MAERHGATLLAAQISSSWSEAAGDGPRQHLIEVTFPAGPVAVDYVSFRNFYTAAITVSHTNVRADVDSLQPMHVKGRPPSWQVVVARLTLMADPHCEDDAQRYHELTHARHFAKEFDHRRVTRLRICCIQPSPSWREYGLKHLRFYSLEPPSVPTLQPPPTLNEVQRALAATVLEQLVGLGRVTSEMRHSLAMPGASLTSDRGSTATRLVFGGGGGNGGAAAGSGGLRTEAGAHTLAPYLVGEWSDELRLTPVDSPQTSAPTGGSTRPSSAHASGQRGVRAL